MTTKFRPEAHNMRLTIRELPPALAAAVEHVALGLTAPLNIKTPALVSSLLVTPSPSALYGFVATSTLASAQFIQLFDAQVVPANGAVPLFAWPIAASAGVSVYYGLPPRIHDLGIVLANSTTEGALTLGAANTLFDVQYV